MNGLAMKTPALLTSAVDAAEAGQCLGDHPLRGVRVGDVAPHGEESSGSSEGVIEREVATTPYPSLRYAVDQARRRCPVTRR